MRKVEQIRIELSRQWIPFIYRDRIRSGRTRATSMEISQRENDVELHFTLLGIELKVGRRRIACPDLASARYLRVFARIGCQTVAVPYDITKISPLADDLEVGWQRTLLLIDELAGDSKLSMSRLRSAVVKEIRSEIEEIGPGEYMPEFRQSTGQSNY